MGDCFPSEIIYIHSRTNSLPCSDAKTKDYSYCSYLLPKLQPMLQTITYWMCVVYHLCNIRVIGLRCWPSVRVSNNQGSVLHQSGVFSYSAVTWSVWAYYYTTPTNYNTAFVFPLVDHLWHGLDFLSMSRCCCNWILGSINIRESLPWKVWWLQLQLAQSRPALVQTPPARSITYNYFISIKIRQISM